MAGADLSIDDAISINNLAGSSLGFDFDVSINNLVGSELDLDYAEASAVDAGADLDLDWDLQFKSEVGVDLDIDAEIVLSTPRSDLTFGADVSQETPFTDLVIDAALGSATSIPLVKPKKGGIYYDPQLPPRVPYPVHGDLTINHAILSRAAVAFAFSAAIAMHVQIDLEPDHGIRNRITGELELDHPIVDWWDTNQDVLLSEIDDDLALVS